MVGIIFPVDPGGGIGLASANAAWAVLETERAFTQCGAHHTP